MVIEAILELTANFVKEPCDSFKLNLFLFRIFNLDKVCYTVIR